VTVQKSREHEIHLPFKITTENQFSDLTGEEFIKLIAKGAIVPESMMSQQGEDGIFSVREERVPLMDKIDESLPANKNWFEEGMIGAPQDQHAL